MFHENTWLCYRKRAAEELNKNAENVTDKDVLRYLDNRPSGVDSKTLFFSYLPMKDMPYLSKMEMYNGDHEYVFKMIDLWKHSISNPIMVGYGYFGQTGFQEYTWDKFYKEFDKFKNICMRNAKKMDPSGGLAYKGLPHFALRFDKPLTCWIDAYTFYTGK